MLFQQQIRIIGLIKLKIYQVYLVLYYAVKLCFIHVIIDSITTLQVRVPIRIRNIIEKF